MKASTNSTIRVKKGKRGKGNKGEQGKKEKGKVYQNDSMFGGWVGQVDTSSLGEF